MHGTESVWCAPVLCDCHGAALVCRASGHPSKHPAPPSQPADPAPRQGTALVTLPLPGVHLPYLPWCPFSIVPVTLLTAFVCWLLQSQVVCCLLPCFLLCLTGWGPSPAPPLPPQGPTYAQYRGGDGGFHMPTRGTPQWSPWLLAGSSALHPASALACMGPPSGGYTSPSSHCSGREMQALGGDSGRCVCTQLSPLHL